MQQVLVMTDSVACIPKELAAEHRIEVVPAANIMYGKDTYIDGITIDPAQAYELLKRDPDRFYTTAITPEYLLGEYRRLVAKSRNILFITLAAELSAVSKTAGVAAEILQKESPETTVWILDSRTVASGQGLVVLAAAKAAARGMSLEEVADVAEKARQKTSAIMLLDTLRYVYRTGRMSKLASRVLSILNIKPINKVTDEGTIEMVARTRKREDGLKQLLGLIKKEAESESLHFMVTHADDPEVAERVAGQLKQEFNCLSTIISEYSPVMGYGAGPGAVLVGFHPELDFLK